MKPPAWNLWLARLIGYLPLLFVMEATFEIWFVPDARSTTNMSLMYGFVLVFAILPWIGKTWALRAFAIQLISFPFVWCVILSLVRIRFWSYEPGDYIAMFFIPFVPAALLGATIWINAKGVEPQTSLTPTPESA